MLTVTITADEIIVFPAASRALAVNVWLPLVVPVVTHETEYGAATSSDPRLTPSSKNCTPATPMLSEALAVTFKVPATVPAIAR